MNMPDAAQSDRDPNGDAIEKRAPPRRLLKGVLVAVLLVGAVAAVLVPAVRNAREQANRASCQCHLKQIGLAMHNYLSTYGSFPPAYTVGANGRPMHSWRTILLSSFEGGLEADFGYDFNEPWDSPNNLKAVERMPKVYRCPSDAGAPEGTTNYVAVVGDETFWPHASARKVGEITDGTSNTIALVEVTGLNIPWTKPVDLELAKIPLEINPRSGDGIASQHDHGVDVLMADASVRFLRAAIEPSTLRAMLTAAGGEKPPETRD